MNGHWMWGMHAGWWVITIVVIVAVVAMLIRSDYGRYGSQDNQNDGTGDLP